MKLYVPYYRQTGLHCWYYCVKMIRDYHKRGLAELYQADRQRSIDEKVARTTISECNDVVGPLTLTGAGFEKLDASKFNTTTDGAGLGALLRDRGPLFLPMWGEGHANVVVGVERNQKEDVFPEEEWVVFVHDPGMDNGDDTPLGLKEMKTLLWAKQKDENLWAFQSKSGKKEAVVRRMAPLVREE